MVSFARDRRPKHERRPHDETRQLGPLGPFANLRALTLPEKLSYLVAQTAHIGAKMKARLARTRAHGAHLAPQLRRVSLAHGQAADAYVPRAYPGRVTLFWPQHRVARSFVDPCFGWRPTITGELDIHLIPARTGPVIQDPEAAPRAAAELRQLVRQIAVAQG